MLTTSEALYNSIDRAIEFKLDVYFDGNSNAPMEMLRSNHLVDLTILDEACYNGDTYMGVPSANELTATVYGSNGIFNVFNTSSPLYGKIKTGVKVCAYVRLIQLDDSLDDYDWDPIGIFYISDWSSDLTGNTASLTATDKLADCITDTVTALSVAKDTTYLSYLSAFLLSKGIAASIKTSASEDLPYGYIDGSDSEFLKDFSYASQLFVYCNHLGNVEVRHALINTGVTTHYLDDTNQIVSISSKQSVVLDYTDAYVSTYHTMLTEQTVLLELKDISVHNGDTLHYTNVAFNNSPVYSVIALHVDCASGTTVDITNVQANPTSISFDVECTQGIDNISITIIGTAVIASRTEAQNNATTKSIDCKYVEDQTRATQLSTVATSYLTEPFSTLELEVRGNPFYEIGDLACISSDTYGIEFTGIIIRQDYKYDGGLSAKLTVLKVL